MPTCGSLFSGAGLLDCGLTLAGWEHRWFCEADEFRRGILAKRFPGAVVYDDVRTLRGPFAADASSERRQQDTRGPLAKQGAAIGGNGRREPDADYEPTGAGKGGFPAAARVDLIAGGFPCKGASSAGKRQGFGHAETVLWDEMRRVIREVRPRYVLIENVANIRGMAAYPGQPKGSLWGTVLGDLAALGFGDIRWDCIPAGAVGAPHLRDRVFCVATNTRSIGRERRASFQGEGRAAAERGEARDHAGDSDSASTGGIAVEWGDYRPAIDRWAAIHGPAPEPLVRRLDDGDAKLQRLRARVDRSRLSALGDGVHVYCGRLVGNYIMEQHRKGPHAR